METTSPNYYCLSMKKSFSEKVYQIAKQIPPGKVATYGQIAAILGNPRAARAVGNALHQNKNPKNIPCHRVVDWSGRLSKNYAFGGNIEQRRRLEEEGVETRDEMHVKLPIPQGVRETYWPSFLISGASPGRRDLVSL